MKHFFSAPLLALAVTAAFAAGPAAPRVAAADDAPALLAIGSPVPMADVKLKSVDGRDVTIHGVAGKRGTLVVFTCNHCPWAKLWQERIAAIGNAGPAHGIGVIAINSNDPDEYPEDSYPEMQARAKQLKLRFPYAVDATSDVARAFGASRTPEAFLFDASGKLVYHGTVDDNAREPDAVKQPWLRDAVDAVAAGKSVGVAETKAFGCGIKYRARRTG